MKQSETKQNITNIIEEYSQEFGIAPQFVEKDFYVTKILSEISEIQYPNIKIIFSGGTCLSKAYHKIKRFSEDIDFRIHTTSQISRIQRKTFCDFILQKLCNNKDYKILTNTIKKGNENKFFSFDLEYNKLHIGSNLRPNIKAEFTFENVILPPKNCTIKSLIGEFIDESPITIECIQPVEVIANKLSALMWRVYIKDRTKPLHTKENDPTIVRHLHDIAALEDLLFTDEFVQILQKSYEADRGRGGLKNDYTLIEFLKITLDKLKKDKIYNNEYSDFVTSMSYAKTSEIIPFENTLEILKKICKYIE